MMQRDPRTYAVIGAAMHVHKTLGCGVLKAIYQEALELELQHRDIPYRREAARPILYGGHQLSTSYRADCICYECVIVELKALAQLGGHEEAQIINYPKSHRL